MGLAYTAQDLAVLFTLRELGVREEAALLDRIWTEERAFFAQEISESRRKFLLDVAYWTLYLREKPCIDREFPTIQRDAANRGARLQDDQFLSDFSDLDLYFKGVRFQLRFFSDRGYVRVKLRTLLKHYGYRRRSAKLLEHMEQCMAFYRLQPYLRGGVPCSLSDTSIDDMIVFRLCDEQEMIYSI